MLTLSVYEVAALILAAASFIMSIVALCRAKRTDKDLNTNSSYLIGEMNTLRKRVFTRINDTLSDIRENTKVLEELLAIRKGARRNEGN